MEITARNATDADLPEIVRLYEDFAVEQSALRPLWHESEGISDPAGESVARLIDADSVTVGTIDDSILGFLISGQRSLVDGVDRVGVIRYIYTEPEARGVGLADEMFGYAVAKLRAGGVELFDAIVSPGHREAKNFYEAHGFSARSIVMHSSDPIAE